MDRIQELISLGYSQNQSWAIYGFLRRRVDVIDEVIREYKLANKNDLNGDDLKL